MKKIEHFIGIDHGGVAHFLQALVRAQCEFIDRSIEGLGVFGPATLALPDRVSRKFYDPVRRSTWGLNQWNFAFRSAREIQNSRSTDWLTHTHHYTLAKADVHTVHGLYCRDWQAMFRPPWGRRRRIHNWLQFLLLSSLERRNIRNARWVVFASKENMSYAEHELGIERPERFVVINHGVDSTRFHPDRRAALRSNRQAIFPAIDPSSRWLLFVGNNYLLKGLLRIITAFSRMPDAGPEMGVDLLVLGNDTLHLQQAMDLSKGSLQERVHFMDDAKIPEAFGLCDVFLMDSESEAGPLVLLEAMASGCVPVVSRFGYAAEFIKSGWNGRLEPDAAAIVESALRLSREELLEMSENAVKTGRARSWQKVALEYEDLYKVAYAGNGPSK